MDDQQLIPHLFRTEFSKISSVLTKFMGVDHIDAAEDIASETFLSALETWSYKGAPPNPTAWLYTVAKNKAKNYIKRNNLFSGKITSELKETSFEVPEIDLSEKNIMDSQLQMLFAISHPSIPQEAQIGLSLRILCGFGIDEIANAFLSNRETINKRLFRAKEKLREEKIIIEFPGDAEIDQRLETVLTTLYLVFNEGYYSETQDSVLREDLCKDAMRLMELLMADKRTDLPPVHALFALMCFHSSRFAARKNASGEIILFHDQNEALWNQELISKGAWHLQHASTGNILTKYHLEAGIAYWHTIKNDTKEKWENILQLYNKLLQVAYSPVAALNRTFALSKARSKEEAIKEAEKLKLSDNHFYFTLLGDLYSGINNATAIEHLKKALVLAKTNTDKNTISRKIAKLD